MAHRTEEPCAQRTCVDCAAEFAPKPQPGRPRIRCEGCSPPNLGQRYTRRPRRPAVGPIRYNRQCEECGTEWRATIAAARFCSRECQGRAQLKKRDEAVCQNCLNRFVPKARDRTRFCSRACSFAHRTANAKGRLPRRPISRRIWIGECTQCAQPFVRRQQARYCSLRCGQVAAQMRKCPDGRTGRGCAECARYFTPVYGDKRRRFCSDACAARQGQRVARRRRDAALRGAYAEAVDPLVVFERDGWKCRLCGRRTPRRLRGTIDGRAPELDHIMPLSKGGEHTYRNTQCACRECNGSKGARPLGQLLLFG